MLFEIKTLTGIKYKLDSSYFKTILDIKIYLQEKEGIEVKQIRLVSNGKQLNDISLVSNVIQNNMQSIFMVLALR
jgi:hypothetical protein